MGPQSEKVPEDNIGLNGCRVKMCCEIIVQRGILKGNFEENNFDPHVDSIVDGKTYTYLVGSASWSKLGKLFKAGDEVSFVDTSPSYQGYKGPKYCALLCPYCGNWW
jgi:hypothetical protein